MRLLFISAVGMIPYSESAAIGWPPVNSVSGSMSSAWRRLLPPA